MRWDLDSAAMEDLSQKTKMEMFRDQIGVDQGCGKDEGGNPHMCCDGPLGREKWMTGGECVNKLYSPFAMGLTLKYLLSYKFLLKHERKCLLGSEERTLKGY
jgi:hypothetical protein